MVYRTANVSSQTCSYDKWKPTGIRIDVINVDDTKITPRGHNKGTRGCKRGGEMNKSEIDTHLWECFSKLLLLQIPSVTSGSIGALLSVGRRDGACGHFIRKHERQQTSQSVGSEAPEHESADEKLRNGSGTSSVARLTLSPRSMRDSTIDRIRM